MRFSSLRVRLLFLVLLAVVPALGLIFYTASEQRRLAADEVKRTALRLAWLAAADQERLIEGARQLLVGLAQLPSVRRHDAGACGAFFADLLRRFPFYVNLVAAKPNGDIFCGGVPPADPVNIADRVYFKRALETRDFTVGGYLIGRIIGKPILTLAYPSVDSSGGVLAVVVAGLDLGWLVQLVADAQLPRGSTCTVLDHSGTILARHPEPEKWVGRSARDAPIVEAILTQQEGVIEGRDIDGIQRLFAFTELLGTREAGAAHVSIGIPKEVAFADVNRILARNLAGLGVVGVLALVAAWFGGDLFVLRRVRALLDATKRLAAGNLRARTGLVYGRGELDQLARAFDEMAESLEQRDAQLRAAEAGRRTNEEEIGRQREALLQREKLAAMGELLAGVAHELNNPLSVVTGQAALLRQMAGEGPVAVRAEKISQAAERCARIVKNFLALARQRPPERQRVQLNRVIREAVELVAYPLNVDNVEVSFDLLDDLPVLWADPYQLQQVVVNLITNAHHAMRETPPPRRLTLTSRFDPDQGRVSLEVADTGPGIPPGILTRIFEPFFTTKPTGQGTGLGLSLCQGIVEGHGGSIGVESEAGRGAAFRIELPVGAVPAAEAEVRAGEEIQPIAGKAILVVDDEPEVAGVLTDLLSADGHQVETAANGMIAMDKLRERSYDLIVSDLKMPELDGPGLYREVERRHPDLIRRFVFVTGDILGPETRAFLDETGAPNLSKPFALEVVRRVVQQALQSP